MREFLESLFYGTGLASMESPWLASLVLHTVLAGYLVSVVQSLRVAARRLKGMPPGLLRSSAAFLYVGLISVGMVLAVGLQSFVTHRGTDESPGEVYEWYAAALFALASAVGLLAFVRAKLHEGWRT
jgi:hypothetical protein